MGRRYRGISGKSRTQKRTDPLVKKMGEYLKFILNSPKQGEISEKIPKEIVPNIPFFIEYVRDITTWRKAYLDPNTEEEVIRQILEKIQLNERTGVSLGFSLKVLRAVARAVTNQTTSLREVEEWKRKLRKLAGTETKE